MYLEAATIRWTWRPAIREAAQDQVCVAVRETRRLAFDEAGKISWTPKENGKFELVVEAVDDGLPAAKTQQKVVLKVVDPVVAPAPKVEPQFDVATQSYVSAVLGGRERNEVWIRSKTDNKSFVAVKGDEISVGSVKGKILDVNVEEQFAELETEGRRWILSMDDASLQAAYQTLSRKIANNHFCPLIFCQVR